MTWDAYNRRKKTLREMLAIADLQRDVTLTDLFDMVDEDHESFANETDLLFDLQMAWFQRLSGQMDALVSEGTETPELTTMRAWVNAAAAMPGARSLLDAHRDEPALQKAFAKEFLFLATSSGVPINHPDRDDRGQRIQNSARESVVHPAPFESTLGDEARPSLIARLRSVIAA